jgi:hypothetical protein
MRRAHAAPGSAIAAFLEASTVVEATLNHEGSLFVRIREFAIEKAARTNFSGKQPQRANLLQSVSLPGSQSRRMRLQENKQCHRIAKRDDKLAATLRIRSACVNQAVASRS